MKPVDLRTFNNSSETVAALRAGQTEANIEISDMATDLQKRGWVNVQLTDLGSTEIAIAFQDKDLATAAADTLTAMRADGTYDRIFDKFGMVRLPGKTFAIRGPGPE